MRMAILVTTALTLGSTASACAQEREQPAARDTAAARDSAARVDSARAQQVPDRREPLSRRDSILLEREMERIRNEPRRLPPYTPATPPPAGDTAQPPRDPPQARAGALRGELAVSLATPFVRAGTVRVRAPIGVSIAGGAVMPLSPAVRFVGSLRGAIAPVEVDHAAAAEPGGNLMQLDLVGAVERLFTAPWAGRAATAHAGAGVAWLRGPEDVYPFGDDDGARVNLTGEVGGSVRLSAERPLALAIATQALRLGRAPADADAHRRWVGRLLVGVRYGG